LAFSVKNGAEKEWKEVRDEVSKNLISAMGINPYEAKFYQLFSCIPAISLVSDNERLRRVESRLVFCNLLWREGLHVSRWAKHCPDA
jgi:hypothetical protein